MNAFYLVILFLIYAALAEHFAAEGRYGVVLWILWIIRAIVALLN